MTMLQDHGVPRSDAATNEPSAGKGLRRVLAFALPPLILAILFGGEWYAFSYLVLNDDNRFLVPPPHQVWQEGLGDPGARPSFSTGY